MRTFVTLFSLFCFTQTFSQLPGMDKVRNTKNDVDELKGMFGGNKKSSKNDSEDSNKSSDNSQSDSNSRGGNVGNNSTSSNSNVVTKNQGEVSKGGPLKHHTELVNLLPNITINGYSRNTPNGNTTRMNTTSETGEVFEFAMSNADVTYESADGKTITVMIMDYNQNGAYLGLLCLSADMNFSVDNMDGYSKSITYKGFKGFETANYDRENNGENPDCAMFLCVRERYYISVSAQGTKDLAMVKNLMDKIDFSKLD